MREHVVEKYFCYRRRYVNYIVREAPQRARLAVLAEIARLAFVAAGSALCALILWTLTLGALNLRQGPSAWSVPFALLALLASAATLGALAGIVDALRDRSRVAGLVDG
jgi:hypothetical protein